jgi:hypothetical protein
MVAYTGNDRAEEIRRAIDRQFETHKPAVIRGRAILKERRNELAEAAAKLPKGRRK